MPKIFVVILNYNGRHFLEQFLPKIVAYSAPHQVLVADNASTDDSLEWLKKQHSSVKIIQNTSNFGFAGGYNEALKGLEADYFLLLNSDVEVTPNYLEPMLALAETNANIAAIQPKIKDFKKTKFFEYAGAAGGLLDCLGYPFCRGRIFDTLEEDKEQYNDVKPIFWASGAAMFVRAKVFKALGGFDDAFFAHQEEIDLCWRMHSQGYQLLYCPQSAVFHVGGGTLQANNPRKTFLNFRNNLAMIYKNLPANELIWKLPLRLCLDGISGIKFLLEGSFQACFAIIKAHFAFYAMLPSLHQKRKQQAQSSTNLYPKSIVWEYFVKGKHFLSDF